MCLANSFLLWSNGSLSCLRFRGRCGRGGRGGRFGRSWRGGLPLFLDSLKLLLLFFLLLSLLLVFFSLLLSFLDLFLFLGLFIFLFLLLGRLGLELCFFQTVLLFLLELGLLNGVNLAEEFG